MNLVTTLCFLALIGLSSWLAFRLRSLRLLLREIAEASTAKQNTLIELPKVLASEYSLQKILDNLEKDRQERTSLEKLLFSKTAFLEVLETELNTAVVILNNSNFIDYANPAASSLLELGSNPRNRIEFYLRSVSLLNLIARVRETGTPVTEEVQIQFKERMGWFEVSGSPFIGDPDRAPNSAILLFHDVTRLKALETVRRDFVADVSHELRTPITIIKGFAQTLTEDYPKLDEDRRKRFLQKIHRSVERLHALVEDLLSLSRLEAGHTALDLVEVDLISLVEHIIEEYRERHPGNENLFEFVHPPEDCTLRADRLQLEQVLRNLLDNALRYAETHTFIRVAIKPEPAIKCLVVEVEDNGIGIPRQEVERIFQRFYRIDKGRSREKGGTGLGLSIVKHIVQLHGGEVQASSFPGRGLKVSCRFPLSLGDPPNSLSPATTDPSRA
ncbi:MAG: sensor histidine kinase [Puniceicoccaceae bacterium]